MANICNCHLQVSGDEDAVDEFCEQVRTPDTEEGTVLLLDFRRHVPAASAYVISLDAEANREAWGTDLLGDDSPDLFWPETTCSGSKGEVTYQFVCKNSPPASWLRVVGALHNRCRFELTYGEGGLCFAGEIIIDGGYVITDNEYTDDEAVSFLDARGCAWMVGVFDTEEGDGSA
jgi:hypothetical protein